MKILIGQTVDTKEFGRSIHDVFNPVMDGSGFWQKGEIKLHDQMVPVEKEPHTIWRQVGLSTPYTPHPMEGIRS